MYLLICFPFPSPSEENQAFFSFPQGRKSILPSPYTFPSSPFLFLSSFSFLSFPSFSRPLTFPLPIPFRFPSGEENHAFPPITLLPLPFYFLPFPFSFFPSLFPPCLPFPFPFAFPLAPSLSIKFLKQIGLEFKKKYVQVVLPPPLDSLLFVPLQN